MRKVGQQAAMFLFCTICVFVLLQAISEPNFSVAYANMAKCMLNVSCLQYIALLQYAWFILHLRPYTQVVACHCV